MLNKMNEMEVYFEFFHLWFEKYSKNSGNNLFRAGKSCEYVMNLMFNPFVAGTREYDPMWEDICLYFLHIDSYDEWARKALVRRVIRFAMQDHNVNKYVTTKTIDGVETKEIIYYTE